MFTIICIGRSDFLIAVLNGLAMLTSTDGPAGFAGLIALGLLVGVILTLMRAVITQKLELQWILGGWLLYSSMFAPKTTVAVQDMFSGATTTVANVPVGPAIIGSITSTVGVSLASAFGTVFAFPSMTSTGYMESLDLIQAMRDMDYGSANDGSAASNIPGIDLQRSLRNYLLDCVFYDISMDLPTHSVTWQKLQEAPDLLAALQVNSTSWFTTVYLQSGAEDGQTLTCTDAYSHISSFIQSPFLVNWNQYVGSVLNQTDPVGAIQTALDGIFGVGHDAQTFMLNALLKREVQLAELGYAAQSNNPAGTVMRVQAMEQRRTQWAAEQSLFAEMARPAISFLEGFFYACSPFVAFLLCLGPFGVGLAARYMLLAVWIQLWMPVLAICQLFISVAASNDLQRIGTAGTDLLSIVGLDSVWTETASWLAFGGEMVAATPLLSLILLTGSYFALTTLTSRMAGGDHIDARIPSPDILQEGAVAGVGALGQQSSVYSRDPFHSTMLTNASDVVPKIHLGSDIQQNIRSAESDRRAAETRLDEVFSTGIDLSHQRGREQFESNLGSNGFSASHSQSDAVVEQMMRSAVNNEGVYRNLTQDERNALAAALGVAFQGENKSFKGLGADASISNSLSDIRSIGDSQRKEIANRIEHMVGQRSEHMSQLADKVQEDASHGLTSRFLSSMGIQDQSKWAEAYQDVRSKTESFERADALAHNMGLRQQIDPLSVGPLAVREGWSHELYEDVSAHGLNVTELEEKAARLAQRTGLPYMEARAAQAALMLGTDSADSRLALAARLSAHGFGTPEVQLGDPTRLEGVSSGGPAFESAAQHVQAHIRPLKDGQYENIPGEVAGKMRGEEALHQDADAEVARFFEAHKQGNVRELDSALKNLDGIITAQQAKHYEKTYEETRGFLKAVHDFDYGGQLGALDINFSGLKEAGHAFAASEEKALAAGLDWKSATMVGLSAAFQGYGRGFDQAVQARHDHAFEEAKRVGLPEKAAEYYADQNVLLQQGLDVSVPRVLGRDKEYERRKAEVKELVGDKAFRMLNRASTAEPVAKNYYLEGAAAIYKERSSHPDPVAPTLSPASSGVQ